MEKQGKQRGEPDPAARIEADDIIAWAGRLNVTPEELRSAVQEGGASVAEVVAELKRRGFEPKLED